LENKVFDIIDARCNYEELMEVVEAQVHWFTL